MVKKKRVHHRLTLKNGFAFEIGWDFQSANWQTRYYLPGGGPDEWDVGTNNRWGKTVKEVIGSSRLHMAEILNPEIREVRLRLSGGNQDLFTEQRLQRLADLLEEAESASWDDKK